MILFMAVVMTPISIRLVCGELTIPYLGRIYYCFFTKEKSLCVTLAGHRAAILFRLCYHEIGIAQRMEAEPPEERLPRRHGAFEGAVPCHIRGNEEMDHAHPELGAGLWGAVNHV